MKNETRRWIQIALLLAILVAGIRLFLLWQGRREHSAPPPQTQQAGKLNPDYYVTPKKLRAYDLNSARELTQQPVWAKEGYRYSYYPYDPARKRADLEHEAGQLGPIEQLRITDVVTQPMPASKGARHVFAIFEKNGKSYALPIGTARGDDFRIYADEALFLEDPRQLYKHWPADVWVAIEKHEVKPGMNELQASFAVGMGIPKPATEADEKIVNYPNGGKPLTVRYRNGRAVEVTPASAS